MGGVPVLFMIAAMGITYGWQPDNRGGVANMSSKYRLISFMSLSGFGRDQQRD